MNQDTSSASLYNLKPLSLFKVPDTLTSATICANYNIYLSQRPEKAEVDGVRSVLEGMPPERQHGGRRFDTEDNNTSPCPPLRVHFCGLSSAHAVSAIEAWRRAGRQDISCGTAPHFLITSSEMLAPGCTLAKCSPPIRDGENLRMLRESVSLGAVKALSSWHLVFESRQKMLHSGDLIRSVGGINSIQTLVPACWTFCQDAGLGPEIMGTLLSKGPAESLGIGNTRGSIKVGAAADLCVVDLEAAASLADVHTTNLLKSLKIPLRGRILQTWVRGHCVFNLADPALMSESAMSIAASLSCVQRDSESPNADKFVGTMLRST